MNFIGLVIEAKWLFCYLQCPQGSMHCFSRKRRNVCKFTLSTWTPAWGLEGLFRSPRAKLYFTALFPLARVVGKTNWYFHSESNCLKNNVSSYCSQSARNRNTWSSKTIWLTLPAEQHTVKQAKTCQARHQKRKSNTHMYFHVFLRYHCTFFFKASQMLDTNHANHLTLCTRVFSMWILGLKAIHWKR